MADQKKIRIRGYKIVDGEYGLGWFYMTDPLISNELEKPTDAKWEHMEPYEYQK
jgi:hypothetical protein